jgi:hypothetical protein
MSDSPATFFWAGECERQLQEALTAVFPEGVLLRQFIEQVVGVNMASFDTRTVSNTALDLVAFARRKLGAPGLDVLLWRTLASEPRNPAVAELAHRRLGLDWSDSQGVIALVGVAFRSVEDDLGLRELIVDHAREFARTLAIPGLELPPDSWNASNSWRAAEILGALADLPARTALGGCTPLGGFLAWITARLGGHAALKTSLSECLGPAAWDRHVAVAAKITAARAQTAGADPPTLMILVKEKDPSTRTGFAFHTWVRTEGGMDTVDLPVKHTACDDRASVKRCLKMIRRYAVQKLRTDDRALRIEFIVSEALLALAPEREEVESEDETPLTLGELNPLSIRYHPRMLALQQDDPEDDLYPVVLNWKRRWNALQASVTNGALADAVITIESAQELAGLRERLRKGSHGCVIFTGDDSASAPAALRQCLLAGVPVILWRRPPPDRSGSLRVQDPAEFLSLRERVRDHRADGGLVTLVWDEPDHVPRHLPSLTT